MNAEPSSVFLTRLFAPYPADADLTLELRAIASGSRVTSKHYALTHTDEAARAARNASKSADVYVGVLPRDGEGTKDYHVTRAAFLYIDIDAGEDDCKAVGALLRAAKAQPMRKGGAALPTPSMAVESGSGGGHFYWQLADPAHLPSKESRALFSSVLRRLCRVIGGATPGAHCDTSCVNPSRILRVPGTLNHKHDPPAPVRLWVHEGEPHPLEWWDANLPAEPSPEKPRFVRRPLRDGDGLPPGLIQWARQGYKEGRRHKDLVGAAAFLKRDCGLSDERGYSLFVMKAQQSAGTRPITAGELDNIWNWA